MKDNNEQKVKNFSFRLEKSLLEEMHQITEINWAGLLRNHIQSVLNERKQQAK